MWKLTKNELPTPKTLVFALAANQQWYQILMWNADMNYWELEGETYYCDKDDVGCWIYMPDDLSAEQNKVQEYLILLQGLGWSDLIDSQWEPTIIDIIKNYDPNAKQEDIDTLLKVVIYDI